MSTPDYPRFHLAVTVHDLAAARRFYADVLGCPVGRESDRWTDFDFFGHQLTVHLAPPTHDDDTSEVDGHAVPARHFGPVLDWHRWHALVERLQAAGIDWVMEPTVRFTGEAGEQATCFIADPSGNHIEFKTFRNLSTLFSSS